MFICVILRQGQKVLVPCKHNIASDTLKGLRQIHLRGYGKLHFLCSVEYLLHHYQ